MGLDIQIATDSAKEIYAGDYYSTANNQRNKHSINRTFCNFMCRQHVAPGEPELDQIGRITNLDISPLYKMEKYQDENDLGLQYLLEVAKTEEEKLHILEQAKASREKLSNNIDTVLALVNALLQQPASINNLHELLQHGGDDTPNILPTSTQIKATDTSATTLGRI